MVYYNFKWIHTFLLVTIYEMCVDAASDIRFPAKAFSNSTLLGGRRVMCHRDHDDRKLYPNDAYKCHNISIDGLRLRHLNLKSYSRVKASERKKQEEAKQYAAKNNIAALCNEMLKEHGVSKNLWTVYAKDAVSEVTRNDRLIFVKTRTGYSWEETPKGEGYIRTIVCMVDER